MKDGTVVMPRYCAEEWDQISERLAAFELGKCFHYGIGPVISLDTLGG